MSDLEKARDLLDAVEAAHAARVSEMRLEDR